MTLLVAGAAAVDAGKTTFSTGLVHRLDGTGYKPRAGNGYWFDHDDYQAAVADRRLYGKDAKRLAAAASADLRPEAINPLHRLWLPQPGGGQGILGQEDRAFAVDRVTVDGTDRYVVNGTVELPSSLQELPLETAPRVASLPEFNEVMAELHRPVLASLTDEIMARETAVVESYADIAMPLQGLAPAAVAVVEPRRARIYPGDRYVRACEVASGSAYEGRLEEQVGHVVDLLEPTTSITLPAMPGEERRAPSAIADAYEPAYDALLAQA